MSLNSKKSWHPGKATNRAKVQQLEENEIELRRKSERRRQEIEQERLLEANSPSEQARHPSSGRLAWMYTGGNAANSHSTTSPISNTNGQNSLLVGARKIDEKMLAEKQAEAKGAREAARKTAADPMAAFLAQKASKKKGEKTDTKHFEDRTRGSNGKVTKSKKHR